MPNVDPALLRQEVSEFTAMLRSDEEFEDLRDLLVSHGLDPQRTILAGLIGSEDESQYGVFVLPSERCIVFETASDGTLTRWDSIDDPALLDRDFRTASLAVTLVRRREIM